MISMMPTAVGNKGGEAPISDKIKLQKPRGTLVQVLRHVRANVDQVDDGTMKVWSQGYLPIFTMNRIKGED